MNEISGSNGPESLQNFAVDHASPRDEGGCVPEETGILMTMDMEHSDCLLNNEIWHEQIFVRHTEALWKFFLVEAIDVIDMQDLLDTCHGCCFNCL